jgi:hypothetical protein
MLALTHHFIVQCSAWISGTTPQTTLFKDYAVLGDDIVIWNKAVAETYLKVIKSLGVEVGLAKSIVSLNGDALEFAKRTLYKGEDVSPIPYKEYAAALDKSASLCQFVKKYNCSDSVIRRILGLGYKASWNTSRWQIWIILSTFPNTWKKVESMFTSLFLEITDSTLSFSKRWDSQTKWLTAMDNFKLLSSALYKKTDRMWAEAAQQSAHFATHPDPWVKMVFRNLHGNSLSVLIQDLFHSRGIIRELERNWSELISIVNLDRWVHKVSENLRPNSIFRKFKKVSGFDDTFKSRVPGIGAVHYIDPDIQRFWPRISAALKLYQQYEDKISRIQVNQLFNPTHKVSLSPQASELKRMQTLWDTWSKIVLGPVISKSLIPINLSMTRAFVRRFFFATSSATQTLTARSFVIRKLGTPSTTWIKFFDFRTLFWFIGIEFIYSFFFASFLYYIGSVVTVIVTALWSGTNHQSIFMLGLIPFEPLLDAAKATFVEWSKYLINIYNIPMPTPTVVPSYSLKRVLLSIYGLLVSSSIADNWNDIMLVIGPLLPIS